MTQSLVTISNCQAFQLVGENAISLASGDLTLAAPVPLPNSAEASSGASSANDSTAPILTISVGSASFPLFSSTLFGTHDGKPWLYTFLAELAPSAHAAAAASLSGEDPGPGAQGSPSGTFVRVKLPADVETESSETRKRRDAFEDVLIRHGLLKDGVRAAGDEFGRGVSEAAEENQQAMKQSAQSHIENKSATSDPSRFSNATHNVASGAASGTSMAASYTKAASEAISGLAGSVGGYLGRGIASAGEATGLSGKGGDSSQGGDVPSNSGDQRFAAGFRDAASDAGTGVADGASRLYNTASDTAPAVIAHEAGDEATKLATEAGQTARNAGSVVVDATLGTSSVWHGAMAAKGAAGGAVAGGETESKDSERSFVNQ